MIRGGNDDKGANYVSSRVFRLVFILVGFGNDSKGLYK
jgi:hypothetical protein